MATILELLKTKVEDLTDERLEAFKGLILDSLLEVENEIIKRKENNNKNNICDLMITAVNEGLIETADVGKLNMWLRKNLE